MGTHTDGPESQGMGIHTDVLFTNGRSQSFTFNSSTDCIYINLFPFLKDVPLIEIERKPMGTDLNI